MLKKNSWRARLAVSLGRLLMWLVLAVLIAMAFTLYNNDMSDNPKYFWLGVFVDFVVILGGVTFLTEYIRRRRHRAARAKYMTALRQNQDSLKGFSSQASSNLTRRDFAAFETLHHYIDGLKPVIRSINQPYRFYQALGGPVLEDEFTRADDLDMAMGHALEALRQLHFLKDSGDENIAAGNEARRQERRLAHAKEIGSALDKAKGHVEALLKMRAPLTLF